MAPSDQGELFRQEFPVEPFPGESLYSITTRFHLLARNLRAQVTNQMLFDCGKLGALCDFPVGLSHFVSATNRQFGSELEIATSRTVAGAYLPFLTGERRAHAELLMMRHKASLSRSVHAVLGASRTGFGSDHPLRFCKSCVESDSACFNMPYWHQCHQWPGAWVCLKHGRPLVAKRKKAFELYQLPCLAEGQTWCPELERRVLSVASRAQQFWLDFFADCTMLTVGIEAAKQLLREEFMGAHEGVCNRAVGFSGSALNAYLEQTYEISLLPGLDKFRLNRTTVQRHLHNILDVGRSNVHPLRFMAMVLSLFGDWGCFRARCAAAS